MADKKKTKPHERLRKFLEIFGVIDAPQIPEGEQSDNDEFNEAAGRRTPYGRKKKK